MRGVGKTAVQSQRTKLLMGTVQAKMLTSFLVTTIVIVTACGTQSAAPGSAAATTPTLPPKPVGSITEFPLPTANSGPGGMTAGPDGNLWFTESIAQIGRITPTGQITEFPLPMLNSALNGITAGPDGNLWFTRGPGKIGRITPKGQITEFPLPMLNSALDGITTGPDGNLWFTECINPQMIGCSGSKIGRITSGK
jgi:streptogramin lyase